MTRKRCSLRGQARSHIVIALLLVATPATAADIMATLRDYARLAPFVALVERAGLAEPLSTEGPWTVFAPESLPEDSSTLSTEAAAALVRRHLVREKLTLFTLTGERPRTSAAGHQLSFVDMAGAVLVDNVWVLRTDIDADNGVIHIIERAILR